jgi:hypothetical protein
MAIHDEIAYEFSLNSGLEKDKPTDPSAGDIYISTDTNRLYICYTESEWQPLGGIDTIATLDNSLPNSRLYFLESGILMFKTPAGGWMSATSLKEKRYADVIIRNSGAFLTPWSFTAPAGAFVDIIKTANGAQCKTQIEKTVNGTTTVLGVFEPATPNGSKISDFANGSTLYTIRATNTMGAYSGEKLDIWW